jgi:hypothetical protein
VNQTTPFILDIPMIGLPLSPTTLPGGGGSQGLDVDPGDAGISPDIYMFIFIIFWSERIWLDSRKLMSV